MAGPTLKRVLKWAAALVLILAVALTGWTWYVYRQVRVIAEHDHAHVADAIVVMGAAQWDGRPSPVLKARLDHALTLYQQQYAPAIVTTGGYGLDENLSEAHVSAEYLKKNGVEESRIVSQQGSERTTDTVRAASILMHQRSWKTVLVVSDGFHLFRVKKIFEDEGITAYTSPAPGSLIEVAPSKRFWYSLLEVLKYAGYRLVRV